MLMLQRSDEGVAGVDCDDELVQLACLDPELDAYKDCPVACRDGEEEDNKKEDEPVEERVEKWLLAVSEASVQPSTTAPAWVPAIEIGSIKLTAWDDDVNLYSVSLEAMWTTAFGSITEVALQNKDGVKVTRTKDVSNKWEVKVAFVNGYTLAAWSSETLTVIATIGAALNGDTVSFKVTDFEGPKDVDGTPLTTQYVSIVTNNNLWELLVKANTADTTKVKLWEETTLWRFSVKPNNKNEDLVIKSITLEQYGSIKTSYLDDLYLTVDGKKVSTDYYIDRNDIVFTTNIELDKTDTSDVDVLVKGTVTDGLGENVRLRINEAGDVIVEWQKYESRVNVTWLGAAITLSAAAINIQWTEISVSFDKTDTTSTLATSKANFGTLKLKAESSDYSFNKMYLELTATDGTAACPVAPITLAKYGIVDVTLWWDSYNGTPAASACAAWVTTFTIEFDDVDMDQGVSRNLPLVVELEDATAGNKYQFNIDLNDDEKLEDVTNDKTYTSAADAATMNKLLSATAFTTRIMTVEAWWLNVSVTNLKKQNVVLANGKEVTVGMGQFKVTNVEDATLKSLKVAATSDYVDVNNNPLSLEDVASKAYLIVDGKKYAWEILVDNITFSDDTITLAKGSTTDFELQLVMKKKDVKAKAGLITNVSTFNISSYTYKVWDTTVSPTPATSLWAGFEIVTIWTLTADVDVTDNTATVALNYTNVDKTVLAGAKDVVLWRFKFNASQEDIKVTKAEFIVSDYNPLLDTAIKDSLTNVRLATADGEKVNATLTTTEDGWDANRDLVFDDMSYIVKKGTSQYLYLMADVNAIDQTDGWLTEAAKIDVKAKLKALTAIGEASNDDIAATIAWKYSNKTSVRANVPAAIELEKVNLSVWADVLVGKLKITMAAQSDNKDNEGTLDAILTALTPTLTPVWAGVTATALKIRKDGSSNAMDAPAAYLTANPDDAKLPAWQTVTYNIYATVDGWTSDNPWVQVSIADKNTNVVINDQKVGGKATLLNIGNGETPEVSVTSTVR